jgi:hypothetical protein
MDVSLYNKGLSKLPVKFNRVSGYFECSYNQLTSLEGCPKWVGDFFSLEYNELATLESSPEYIGGNFFCQYNQLTDFRGFPEFYEGKIFYNGNPVFEVIKNIPINKYCGFIHLLNEYSVIRPGMNIIRDRLEVAYDGVGLVMPEDIKIAGYEII